MIRTKLVKTSLTLLTTLITPVAFADTIVYGKGHVSIASIDDDNGSATAISSHSSRFGVKGILEKEGDTQIFYKMEWQVDMTDESKASNDHIKSRNQYIGLKDNWGEIRLGRDDSPYKKAGKKSIEFFSDTYADYNSIVDKGQDKRDNSSISYSVKAGPGKLSFMYAAGGDDTGTDPTTDSNYGDMGSLSYDMKIGNINFAIATQEINDSATAANPSPARGNTETATKLVFGYKISEQTQVGLLLETVKDVDDTVDDQNTLISVKQKFGKDAVKFVYGTKSHATGADDTMTALAYDHKLTKAATVYALYASSTNNGLKDSGGLTGDATVIAGGLVVKF
ncbi:MAG: porin [Gammaproteobacteria bacterium]|nr:porin [Gammaproteobacteria bacterium]